MSSERTSEQLVSTLMNFQIGNNSFGNVYAQGEETNISDIDNALKKCGGKPKKCELNDFTTHGSNKGKPEFILTLKNIIDTIIVIECKKTPSKHESSGFSQPSSYNVDGLLYYSKYLKDNFNVIGIAVSGVKEDNMAVSTFYWRKGASNFEKWEEVEDIVLDVDNIIRKLKGEQLTKTYSLEEIRKLAILMNEKMREAKITQDVKPIFIAGILLALKDNNFENDYFKLTTYKTLSSETSRAVNDVLKEEGIPEERRKYIVNQFKSTLSGEAFAEIPLIEDGSLLWYIKQLAYKIKPMMEYTNTSLDALSVFYHEFIQYSTGKDGKLLGQVLTPQHATEFMADLTGITKNDSVLDICCGSGSFLVTAMHRMFLQCKTEAERERIRKNALYGIEIDEKMHCLALTNMIVRHDGKSNIEYGDCFKSKWDKLKEKKINIGLLNPPYSIKKEPELKFVKRLLDLLAPRGIGVVVVPMSCAIGTKFKAERKALMNSHTLKAVFSMPDDLFYPTGTNTCVMVWEAHKPHDKTKETFFGYFKDDGFVKRKQLGRIDAYNKWKDIEAEWLNLYENKKIIAGKTASHCVSDTDEWLCEAYMETDYTTLNKEDFQETVNDYLAYLLKVGKVYEK